MYEKIIIIIIVKKKRSNVKYSFNEWGWGELWMGGINKPNKM